MTADYRFSSIDLNPVSKLDGSKISIQISDVARDGNEASLIKARVNQNRHLLII